MGYRLRKHTISEVARLCGTSKATVSRVLNNPGLVAEPLRLRILAKMEEIGYSPNPFAARLGAKGNWGIALFVFDIVNPFFSLMVREVGHLTMERQIPLTVCDTEADKAKEHIYLDYVLHNRIGGIVFTEGISQSIIERARKQVPVVLIDQHFVPGSIPEVTSDNFKGALQAVEYLIQMNHRRIGFVTGPENWPSAKERYRGYCEALERNNLEFRTELIYRGDFQFESGIRALEYFLGLSDWPTAVFCANDQMAVGVLSKANLLNIQIPADLSLIGFDGIPMLFVVNPNLTTVEQDIPRLCGHAIEMMMKQLNGEKNIKERIIVPTRLQVGETCKKIDGS